MFGRVGVNATTVRQERDVTKRAYQGLYGANEAPSTQGMAKIRRLIRDEVLDKGALDAPSSRPLLIPGSNSTTTRLGQRTELSHLAGIRPEVAGTGAPTPRINKLAYFQPEPPQGVPRPLSVRSGLGINDKSSIWGTNSNGSTNLVVNCMLLKDNPAFTLKALVIHSPMFIYRPDEHDTSVVQRTGFDHKMVGISVLLSLLYHAGDAGSNERYDTLESVMQRWRRWGALEAVTPGAEPFRPNLPVAIVKKNGWTKLICYWAGCDPPVVNGAYLWWAYCLRPRDRRLCKMYRDLLNAVLVHELGPYNYELESRRVLNAAIAAVVKFQAEHADAAWYWTIEPAVTYSPAEPHPLLISAPPNRWVEQTVDGEPRGSADSDSDDDETMGIGLDIGDADEKRATRRSTAVSTTPTTGKKKKKKIIVTRGQTFQRGRFVRVGQVGAGFGFDHSPSKWKTLADQALEVRSDCLDEFEAATGALPTMWVNLYG
jgi:hypothetical protein